MVNYCSPSLLVKFGMSKIENKLIDGIKISLPTIRAKDWYNNKLLKFHNITDKKTKQPASMVDWAVYDGLKFKTYKSNRCLLQGSLHKYYNQGRHNYNDFSILNLWQVLEDLYQRFNINPDETILENVEFGVNIQSPIPSKELIKSVRAYKNMNFTDYWRDRKKVGKITSTKRYEIKIYDKGKQEKIQNRNLIRIEVSFNKMLQLKQHNIISLTDLTKTKTLELFTSHLLEVWDELITHEKGMKYKQMRPLEHKKYLQFINGEYWIDLSKKQRYRSKKKYKEITAKYGTSNVQNTIGNLIQDKCLELTHLPADFCPPLTQLLCENSKTKMSTFDPLEYGGQRWTKDILENSKKAKQKKASNNHQISVQKSRKKAQRNCKVCQAIIDHKRSDAIYCSKRCNNKISNMKRTQKRQAQKHLEIKNLELLKSILPKRGFWLDITYSMNQEKYTDTLHTSEIFCYPKWMENNVCQINVSGYADVPEITFYNPRAKVLLNFICAWNNQKELKHQENNF